MRCETETLRMAPYCVLGDQMLLLGPFYSRGDCVPPRATVGGLRAPWTRPRRPQRSWGLVLAKDCLILPASRNGRGTRMDRNGSSDVHRNRLIDGHWSCQGVG
jgi:hypothetical protein